MEPWLKRFFLEQLNTFSVCGRRCPRTNQVDGHCVGRLFQRRGLAAVNARSPKRELLQGIVQLKLSDDRSCQRPVMATNWQSSDRYGAARLLDAL